MAVAAIRGVSLARRTFHAPSVGLHLRVWVAWRHWLMMVWRGRALLERRLKMALHRRDQRAQQHLLMVMWIDVIYVAKFLMMVHDRCGRLMHDRDGAAGELEARVDQLHHLRLGRHVMVMVDRSVRMSDSVVDGRLYICLTNFVCD